MRRASVRRPAQLTKQAKSAPATWASPILGQAGCYTIPPPHPRGPFAAAEILSRRVCKPLRARPVATATLVTYLRAISSSFPSLERGRPACLRAAGEAMRAPKGVERAGANVGWVCERSRRDDSQGLQRSGRHRHLFANAKGSHVVQGISELRRSLVVGKPRQGYRTGGASDRRRYRHNFEQARNRGSTCKSPGSRCAGRCGAPRQSESRVEPGSAFSKKRRRHAKPLLQRKSDLRDVAGRALAVAHA